MNIAIIYRGLLSECNFSCAYCPFAKRLESPEEQQRDKDALDLFVKWVDETACSGQLLDILITPFGEAMMRPWYREALATLSRTPFVNKIAIQTNLSFHIRELARCKPETTALWTTYHPDFMPESHFLKQCRELDGLGITYSVGTVGIKEHFDAIASLRRALPESVYLWINAFKHEEQYYQPEDIAVLARIDPLFPINLHSYASAGQACGAGERVVSVEGNGDLLRCHFIREKRGNIFEEPLSALLRKEPCSNATCHCHIGYIHLDHLRQSALYGTGLLERIPVNCFDPGSGRFVFPQQR